jgi:hypothetical protein
MMREELDKKDLLLSNMERIGAEREAWREAVWMYTYIFIYM